MSAEQHDPESSHIIRATFSLYDTDVANLQILSGIRDTTPSQVVRQALATEVFIAQQMERGARLLIEEPSPSTVRGRVGNLLLGKCLRELKLPHFAGPQDRNLNSSHIPPAH